MGDARADLSDALSVFDVLVIAARASGRGGSLGALERLAHARALVDADHGLFVSTPQTRARLIESIKA